MEWKKRAFAGLGRWGSSKRLGVRSALVAAGTAVRDRRLLMRPGDGLPRHQSRRFERRARGGRQCDPSGRALKAGDTLTFNFEAAGRPVRYPDPAQRRRRATFVAGGADRHERLLRGRRRQAHSISSSPRRAPRRQRSPRPACRQAAPRRERRRQPRAAARGCSAAPWNDAGNFEVAELAGVVLDAGVPAPSRGSTGSPGRALRRRRTQTRCHHPPDAVDMRLQWRGERYTVGGPDGAEIDTAPAVSRPRSTTSRSAARSWSAPWPWSISRAKRWSAHRTASRSDGWMAGPVTNVKLAPGLTLDARAAWGVAESATDELAGRTVRCSAAHGQCPAGQHAVVRSLAGIAERQRQSLLRSGVRVRRPRRRRHDSCGAVCRAALAASMSARSSPTASTWTNRGSSSRGPPSARSGTSTLCPGSRRERPATMTCASRPRRGSRSARPTAPSFRLEAASRKAKPGTADIWSGRLQLSVPMQ